jgi:hypothetical protein
MEPLTSLAEDERLLRDSVYEFADKEIRPLVARWTNTKFTPVLIELFALGVMGIEFGSYGGGGAGYFTLSSRSKRSRVDPQSASENRLRPLVINALLLGAAVAGSGSC